MPLAFPVIEAFPRAEHWTEWTHEPGLNPAAGLAGLLHRLGYAHPWRDAATRCERLRGSPSTPADSASRRLLAEARLREGVAGIARRHALIGRWLGDDAIDAAGGSRSGSRPIGVRGCGR